jgi:hypothetical protein
VQGAQGLPSACRTSCSTRCMHQSLHTLMYCRAISSSSCTMLAGCPSIGTLVNPVIGEEQAAELAL